MISRLSAGDLVLGVMHINSSFYPVFALSALCGASFVDVDGEFLRRLSCSNKAWSMYRRTGMYISTVGMLITEDRFLLYATYIIALAGVESSVSSKLWMVNSVPFGIDINSSFSCSSVNAGHSTEGSSSYLLWVDFFCGRILLRFHGG